MRGKLAVAGFTNLGYLAHSRRFGSLPADMSDTTVVITGGTSGLGLATARSLSAMGARVVVVGRNPDRLTAAAEQLGSGGAALRADLSLMSDVRRLADRLLETEDRIEVLINNVGVLLPERTLTEEGLEKTLATNLAGHFLLTGLLAGRLIESAPARVVNVSSGGMYTARIRPDDLQFSEGHYNGTVAYARTKRGQVILTEMWADYFSGTGVVVHAMHPGWANTPGVSKSLPTFDKVMRPFLRTPEQGADTIVWLAAADEPGERSGGFWFDRGPAPTHLTDATRESPEDRDRLWAALAELTDLEVGVRSWRATS
ncbi:MAG: SDR family NAD(P)-dependent oxidoreductase [Acidimicrobiia bacterium]